MTIKCILKLNLGSGSRPYKDYLGVDNKSVIKRDVLKYLQSLPKNSVSHIYFRHYLEHVNSDQLTEILSEINRVLVKNGEILFILPHHSNPFLYSDLTHKTFFGVRTLSYFCGTSCLNRHVTSYASIKGWQLIDLKVNFVLMLKIKILGFRLPYMSDILNLLINSHFKLIELYERYLASIFSIYQVKYFVIKR